MPQLDNGMCRSLPDQTGPWSRDDGTPFSASFRPGTRKSGEACRHEEGMDLKDDNILMVEDNPDDALLMMRALRKSGVGNEVVVARDGAEALDLLLGSRGLPNIVLLDVRLPKLNGIEVLERLRGDDRTRHLPVVLLTSREGEREALTGADGPDADFYLPKSMDFDRFLRDVRRIIGPLLDNTCSGMISKPGTTTRSLADHRRTALFFGSRSREPALARHLA